MVEYQTLCICIYYMYNHQYKYYSQFILVMCKVNTLWELHIPIKNRSNLGKLNFLFIINYLFPLQDYHKIVLFLPLFPDCLRPNFVFHLMHTSHILQLLVNKLCQQLWKLCAIPQDSVITINLIFYCHFIN